MVAYAVGSRLPELEATPDPRRRLLDPEVIERWDRIFPVEPYELDPRIVQIRRQGDTAFAAVVAALDAIWAAATSVPNKAARLYVTTPDLDFCAGPSALCTLDFGAQLLCWAAG